MKKSLFIFLLSFILLLGIAFGSSCSKPLHPSSTPLKAAIIDQLGALYPNVQFIRGISQDLENVGFSETVFTGEEINVDFYPKLPSYGFRLIIFRVHSNFVPSKDPSKGMTYLFTNEPYSQSRYVSDQLAGRVVPARVDENSPRYFAVASDFISDFTQGKYDQSVIIMMGCNSLCSPDLSEAFISRGALLYTGWTASVKLDFVDDFTSDLINNLCVKNVTFKQALYNTADEKGIDPTYKAVFSYYPTENENYSLLSTSAR